MPKLTLSLTEREYELVTRLAKENDKGKADVIRDALKMQDYLENKVADGTQVMLKRDKHWSEFPIELFR